MLNVTTRHQGENWSSCLMTVPPNDPSDDLIIDLDDPPAGHRLAELLQALTGCSVERAELAIDDPTPSGPAKLSTSQAHSSFVPKQKSG